MMKDIKGDALPNLFYDLIAFVSPSLLLVLGIIVGLSGKSISMISTLFKDIGAIDFFAIVLGILFIAYQYGRFAEALSHTVITRLFKVLRRTRPFKYMMTNKDFNSDFEGCIDKLCLPFDLPRDKKNNKWTIYFFALLYVPHIGQDLLKRYAWEKLSRSSAFTIGILFIISLVFSVVKNFLSNYYVVDSAMLGEYGFGSISYTFISFILMISTCYEFYLRKCWNNDLLHKVFPILICAEKHGDWHYLVSPDLKDKQQT